MPTEKQRRDGDASDVSVSLESHDSAATLYVQGTLSAAGVLRVMRDCDSLPGDVVTLRVDLRNARLYDPSAFNVLAVALRLWRESREGTTRVDLPREREVARGVAHDYPPKCVASNAIVERLERNDRADEREREQASRL